MAASPARRVAYRNLLRVDTQGSFADELLHAPPERLSERDQALAVELTLGTLRWQGVLDELVGDAAERAADELDPEVRTALRLGAYQLRYLDRVPARAAVSESVELVKSGRRRGAAGLVNAVLRRLPEHPERRHELELSHPDWLVRRWQARYGADAALRLLEANQATPPAYLRLNLRFPPEETLRLLAEEGVATEPTEVPWAVRVVSGRVQATRCWAEGWVRIQDLSSQLVLPLLGLQPEHSLLDLCAAPGGKTQQAAELRRSGTGIVAADLHLHRLRKMRELAFEPVAAVTLDAARPLPFAKTFDRVLVDAPCSGTGSLARNPDIKWRLRPSDLDELRLRQTAILGQALNAVAAGGVLVYATCSLEPEENDQVVDAVLAQRPQWRVAERFERLPGRDPGEGFSAFRLERA